MKFIGNKDFNISSWEIDRMNSLKIKATPFTLYWERNYDKDDTRVQFGIAIFNYRIGFCIDYMDHY